MTARMTPLPMARRLDASRRVAGGKGAGCAMAAEAVRHTPTKVLSDLPEKPGMASSRLLSHPPGFCRTVRRLSEPTPPHARKKAYPRHFRPALCRRGQASGQSGRLDAAG